MSEDIKQPGIERATRISDTGLERLESHLQRGANISHPVLAQWVRRYGEPARNILKKYHCYTPALEDD